MSEKFENLEIRHMAFNAQRTLRNAAPSQFEQVTFAGLQLLMDKQIGFANQIWGLNEQTMAHLSNALIRYDKISKSPYLDILGDDLTDMLKKNLEILGYKLDETLNFLIQNVKDVKPTAPLVQVERLQPNEANMFLDLLKTSGMQTTEEIWQLKKHLYCTDIFRCFVAKIDGQPCAMATTFVDAQYGLLANAYTQSQYQNLGCQTALLQARLNDAKQLGLTDLIVDVVPNTASERNCLKIGFKPLETRYIWEKKAK